MLLLPVFATLALTASIAEAHAEAYNPMANHPLEISRRQMAANSRHIRARNCASAISEYDAKRRARRSLMKRGMPDPDFEHQVRPGRVGYGGHRGQVGGPGGQGGGPGSTGLGGAAPTGAAPTNAAPTSPVPSSDGVEFSSIAATTSAVVSPGISEPYYDTLQNVTCIVAPEVTEGPYYINDEFVRKDLTEGQPGVPLLLDIGILDINTCEPIENAWIEIWHCNATGQYAGFTMVNSGTPTGPPPNSTEPGSGGPPSGGQSTAKTDALNWLRGVQPINDAGLAEFQSVYPGYYTGRTIHIHVMVHQNLTVNANNTIISHSGTARHVGQIFFDEDLNDKVLATDAYLNTTQIRTLNTADGILAQQNSEGHNAFASVEYLGEDLSDGVVGYITIGVDSTYTYDIASTNYYDPDYVLVSSDVETATSSADGSESTPSDSA